MHKLHLGSGQVILPGWINIDIEFGDASARQDLTKPLPYPDASASHIYTEHFIEHLEYEEALRLLTECRRVLADTGVIRIVTPDLEWLVDVYHSGITTEWGELWRPDSPCQLMNEGMRAWGHKFLYDRSELHHALRLAGFNNIVEEQWLQSSNAELKGLESRPFHNDIILEADCLPERVAAADAPTWKEHASDDLLREQGKRLTLLADNNAAQQALINSLTESRAIALRHGADQAKHMEGLEQALEDRGRHILGLEESIKDISRHSNALETDLSQRLARISELERAVKDLITHSDNLQQAVTSQAADIVSLGGQHRALEMERDRLHSDIGKHVASIARLGAELQDEQKRRAATETDLQALQEQLAVKETEIRLLEETGKDLSERLDADERFIGRIRSTVLGRLAIWMLPSDK